VSSDVLRSGEHTVVAPVARMDRTHVRSGDLQVSAHPHQLYKSQGFDPVTFDPWRRLLEREKITQ
jgi:hypothetical protein